MSTTPEVRDAIVAQMRRIAEQWRGNDRELLMEFISEVDRELLVAEHAQSQCAKCGGKGYIQGTPIQYETDTAEEREDARIMARRKCECQEHAQPTTERCEICDQRHGSECPVVVAMREKNAQPSERPMDAGEQEGTQPG